MESRCSTRRDLPAVSLTASLACIAIHLSRSDCVNDRKHHQYDQKPEKHSRSSATVNRGGCRMVPRKSISELGIKSAGTARAEDARNMRCFGLVDVIYNWQER